MEEMIPLEKVAKEHLGIGKVSAMRHARAGTLPVPAFRLGGAGAKRGPFYVLKADLEKHIAERYESARKLYVAMQSVK